MRVGDLVLVALDAAEERDPGFSAAWRAAQERGLFALGSCSGYGYGDGYGYGYGYGYGDGDGDGHGDGYGDGDGHGDGYGDGDGYGNNDTAMRLTQKGKKDRMMTLEEAKDYQFGFGNFDGSGSIGFVYVGFWDTTDPLNYRLVRGRCVIKFGTTKHLGELRNGPLEKTKLGALTARILIPVMRFSGIEEAELEDWEKYMKDESAES